MHDSIIQLDMLPLDKDTAKSILKLIVDGNADEALKIISNYYHIDPPKTMIGLPRGKCFKSYACYVPSKHTIFFKDSKAFRNPYIVLHEFYHVIRFINGKHKGTEKYANEFAKNFIQYALT